jgi:hypothetical protein
VNILHEEWTCGLEKERKDDNKNKKKRGSGHRGGERMNGRGSLV